jgi:hypothetical protein
MESPVQSKVGLRISQRDNYAANFGEVLRSSAIFWVKNDSKVKTTICLTNYWKYKNSTDVTVLVNLRDIGGRLRQRTKVTFDESEVCNYSPPAEFEGSVEVEAFSSKNLRIPYAAVMATYECSDSISMVHSYSRAYSQHEIEDGRTISVGEESCWTVRETPQVTSFCAIHNGSGPAGAQTIRLGIRRVTGEERVTQFELPQLAPFQTVLIEPRRFFPDLVDWLEGKPGNARISFRLAGAFTRMLCGIRALDWTQLQVTHSNFDYSIHETDALEGPNCAAHMQTPSVEDPGIRQEVVVYPDAAPGSYRMRSHGVEMRFQPPQIVAHRFDGGAGVHIEFHRDDGPLPTRIVTGLRLERGTSTIPAECSLGVEHKDRPQKHFSWMVVSRRFDSTVCWVELRDIYGPCPGDAKLVFQFYSPDTKEPIMRECTYSQLPESRVLRLDEVFEGFRWPQSYGYLTVRSSYGGLVFFSTLRKKQSISIEHGF